MSEGPIDSIPIRAIGPGSQPEEMDGARLHLLPMPKAMDRYRMPELPEAEAVSRLGGACAAMAWLEGALARFRVGGEPLMADISALDQANRELVNQILGEGEVSMRYDGAVQARMQESVLAGIWRTVYLDGQGAVGLDLIEVGDLPTLVRRPLDLGRDPASLLDGTAAPAGVANALPILTELREQLRSWSPGKPAHVINLTLLPLSPEELAFLDETLGQGPLQTLSRGYGDCRISATALHGLWWVRYYNAMGTLILNTLEVVDAPQVACAAQEDLDDSRIRLRELLEPYWKELG